MAQAKSGSTTTFILIGVVFLLLIFSGYHISNNLEWVEYDTSSTLTEEAKRNPYLAAKKLLKQYQIELSEKRSFRDFDQPVKFMSETHPDDTFVLVDAYGSLSQLRMEHLLGWVDDGGHLIASMKNPYLENLKQVKDPLFEHFEVETIRREEEGLDEETWELINRLGRFAGFDGEKLCPLLTEQGTVIFDGSEETAGVHFLSNDVMSAHGEEPYGYIGYEDEAHMLQFEVGRGMVTLLPNLDIWKVSAIGCLDHAYVLLQLAPDSGGGITFYRNFEFPSVFKVLWHYFGLALILAASLLILWLWNRGVRFGPIREREFTQQRQLIEHIDASANFLWQKGRMSVLIERLREQLLLKLKQSHPNLFKQHVTEGDRAELAKKLSIILTLTPEQIELALWTQLEKDMQQLTDMLNFLQQIKDQT